MPGFYNLQEASEKLNKSEEEIRQLVRSGELREFRDGPNVMYKSEEIDAMAGDSGDSGSMTEEISLLDSTLGSSGAENKPQPEEPAAEPPAAEEPAPQEPATEEPKAEQSTGNDTSVFSLEAASDADAGKTDVFSLDPGGEEGGDENKSGSGSGSSISLLDDLENITIPADPMAETVVSAGEIGDETPGGSGLMDLARESDDTSLGAELYDDSAEAEPAEEPVAAAPAEAAPAQQPTEYYVAPAAGYERPDPMAPAFVSTAVIGLIALLVAGMAVAAGVMGSWPGLLDMLYGYLLFYLLGGLVLAGIAWAIGWAIGRQGEQRRSAMSRAGAGEEIGG